MFYEWTTFVGLMLGATIGSFLNVVIYRMPLGLSLSNPKHSFCPNCKHRLTVPDLFPLFSWLLLGGKCRHCRMKVPSRYFFVELITGGLFAGIWWQYLVVGSDPARALAYMACAAALVAATFIDLRWFIIPDQLNAFLLVVGIVYGSWLIYSKNPAGMTYGIPSFIAGWFVGALALWSVTLLGRLLFGKDAMGHGDIKLARGFGSILFPTATLVSFGLAIVAGALLGIVQVLVSRRASSAEEDEADIPDEPESISSIFKCGIGYLLAFDVVGLFFPKFYQSYFGEDPYSTEDIEDEFQPSFTTIPFGPYLAVGALVMMLWPHVFLGLIENYRHWAFAESP